MLFGTGFYVGLSEGINSRVSTLVYCKPQLLQFFSYCNTPNFLGQNSKNTSLLCAYFSKFNHKQIISVIPPPRDGFVQISPCPTNYYYF